MTAILLSDVHLNVAPDGRQRMAEFVSFLRSLLDSPPQRLVILGDLFDFWFEYRHVSFSGYFDVLRAFADLRDRGVEHHFVCGNHDFWAGAFLRNRLGFQIHPDRALLDFDGRRVLLVHGDGINPRDRVYRVYKRIARCRPVVCAFRLLHPDWAMALAQAVSRGSRSLSKVDDVSQGPEVAPLRAYAMAALARGEADVVVCGHSHYPVREECASANGGGLYLNTGDWVVHRSYIEWDGEDFRVRLYVLPDKEAGNEARDGHQRDEEQP